MFFNIEMYIHSLSISLVVSNRRRRTRREGKVVLEEPFVSRVRLLSSVVVKHREG